MRETIYEIKLPKGKGTPYKDWTTTVKEARARQIPIGLPENLKNYFENALKKAPISNMLGGIPQQAHEQRRSHDKRIARQNVLYHVSRNRPHPTIFFPFQTGDRLNTYMVWLPDDRHPTSSHSLPPVPQRRNERTPPSRNSQTRHMRRCFGYGQFTGLNQTTYQDEIAKTPFIHRTVNMVDHFPRAITYQDEIAKTPFIHRTVNMVDHFPRAINNNRASLHRLSVR